MNSVQLAIVVVILLLIVVLVGYYFYQENKFRKLVENNFNQAIDDVINDSKSLVIDGVNTSKNNTPTQIHAKDTYIQPVDAEINFDLDINNDKLDIPADSAEAFFIDLDNAEINYPLDLELDAAFDIAFEDITKLKTLPEINHLNQKECRFYIFDKDNCWVSYQKNQKYAARGIRLIVPLIDKDGITSQAQLSNIYNELHNYVLKQAAHLRASDYARSLIVLQGQMKYLDTVPLELNLYLILKEKIHYSQLYKFFSSEGLHEQNGTLVYPNGDQFPIYNLYDENGDPFVRNNEYNILSVKSRLHLQNDPWNSVEAIFDCSEKFMQYFEARLLTTNKQIFGESDYDKLQRHITNYVATAKRNNIDLGGGLLQRLYI